MHHPLNDLGFSRTPSANYFLHSGLGVQGRPSMGAWVSYGLGSSNDDLPGFVVLKGGQIPSGGLDCFGSGFLPASYHGSLLNANGTPLANIVPGEKAPQQQAAKRRFAAGLNRLSLAEAGGNDALGSAIANAELASRMQLAVPDPLDLTGESDLTKLGRARWPGEKPRRQCPRRGPTHRRTPRRFENARPGLEPGMHFCRSQPCRAKGPATSQPRATPWVGRSKTSPALKGRRIRCFAHSGLARDGIAFPGRCPGLPCY